MKVAITSGKAEGPTKLNAFDNALLDAGIGDVNLIKVSSIIPANTEIIELTKLTPGDMINCVLSYTSSSKPGDLISSAIAVATSSDFGCVVEHNGINRNPEEIRKEAIDMVKYMMQVRNMEIKELIVEEINHEVIDLGAVVASLVYLGD
jgi:arginine decarboxylase